MDILNPSRTRTRFLKIALGDYPRGLRYIKAAKKDFLIGSLFPAFTVLLDDHKQIVSAVSYLNKSDQICIHMIGSIFQGKRYGSILINFLKSLNKPIQAYVMEEAYDFFLSKGFIPQQDKGIMTEMIFSHEG
ncbi:MAG: hypothetical protein HQK56_15445 [Deltaproteobacteria bacterium]|nr:hypothetical protein [Deltaproteobacteria bacterium]